ncbi:(2Fe-2S) ferredoxin domain-containing protein [Adhaeribacter aquaticus]|uniref:(2Fe-2S) ferredoxin domain-containing protein n=1 Tax=Adhaeribacter aquaticus TaxID=299567 RepID=UPI000410F3FA|nr:(2Fe-2S) ferredoxin domain-containing protein [Adhaeribacter aquaticus]
MSKAFNTPQQVIYICTGSKCKKKGGKELSKFFRSHLKDTGLKGNIEIIKTDCTDRCKLAPNVTLQPENTWFHQVSEQMAHQILQQHILGKGRNNSEAIPNENPSDPED